MITKVVMPKLSDAMETGKVIKWLKKEGDAVKGGDVIAEIETDKANVEIEAFGAGVLRKLVVGEGQSAPVGDLIAVIADPADDISAVAVAPARPAAAPPAPPAPAAAGAVGAGRAGAAATLEMSSAGSAITAIRSPTGTWPPSAITILRSTPLPNASTSTLALSVSTSTRTSPPLTVSPSFLSHLMTLPVSMASDSLGMITLVIIGCTPAGPPRRSWPWTAS